MLPAGSSLLLTKKFRIARDRSLPNFGNNNNVEKHLNPRRLVSFTPSRMPLRPVLPAGRRVRVLLLSDECLILQGRRFKCGFEGWQADTKDD